MQRRSKQAFIIFIYLLFLLSFLGGIFFLFFYQAPSCTDGKKNQDETGIDCGGRCSEYCLADLVSAPLRISEGEVLAYKDTSSDAIGTVRNPNSKAALKSADYTFTLYGTNGQVVGEAKGEFSLLPLEERTLVSLGLPVAKRAVARAELTVSNEEWVAFPDFTEAPDIKIANQQFGLLSGAAGYAEAKGLVQNKSPYDIRTLGIVVVARDENGQALSVNRTTMNTLQSGETRDFRLVWPESFEGVPARADMEIHFDMLAEDAFIQQYFPGGEFQSLVPRE